MIIGVDLGTRRVALACPEAMWCYRDDTQNAAGKRDYPGEVDAGKALGARARTALLDAMARGALPYLGIEFWFERPMAFANTKTAIGQGMSLGALMGQLPGSIHECSNSQWKKELIGRGDAKPHQYQQWLKDDHPSLAALCGEDEDLAAAHCIALWAELAQGERL